ncbi:hypothetical protein PtA15_15A67 [Puccinia triticina]|uniref:Uncharacterized protein n=1 Tax=Puccinia triticina TaxID=208348 RepID=A0ABY7D9T4_9BASI|nr:uncharacterized protein PtA15_15A67 [Puccinia triticina]WAQ91677.1 hypothetical protein PtA15_15A67 [Puccinia triticina]
MVLHQPLQPVVSSASHIPDLVCRTPKPATTATAPSERFFRTTPQPITLHPQGCPWYKSSLHIKNSENHKKKFVRMTSNTTTAITSHQQYHLAGLGYCWVDPEPLVGLQVLVRKGAPLGPCGAAGGDKFIWDRFVFFSNYDSRKAGELPKIVSAAEQFDDQATVPKGDAMAKGYFHSYQTNPS